MKKTLPALLALILILSGCGGAQSGSRSEVQNLSESTQEPRSSDCAKPDFSDETPDDISTEALQIRNLTIESASGPVKLRVEIADDPDEMAQGLMFRESLGEGCGMLFTYTGEQELSFWMRNTLIPLSIAYIDSDGEIIDLQDMEALDDEPPNYTSAEPAQYALEANVGFFEENGVEVGDTVELPQ